MQFNRRKFLLVSSVFSASMLLASKSGIAETMKGYLEDDKKLPEDKLREKYMNISEKEWKEKLTAQEFDVLREEGTERSGSSPLNNEKRDGIFHCAGCNNPLFKSKTKYESGTGWPSFYDPIEGAIDTKTDFKLFLPRTEYHCARCGGHQGHVFKDGPEPTGKRYCNNGVALNFVPEENN